MITQCIISVKLQYIIFRGLKFESDAEIAQINADFERGRFSKVSLRNRRLLDLLQAKNRNFQKTKSQLIVIAEAFCHSEQIALNQDQYVYKPIR